MRGSLIAPLLEEDVISRNEKVRTFKFGHIKKLHYLETVQLKEITVEVGNIEHRIYNNESPQNRTVFFHFPVIGFALVNV